MFIRQLAVTVLAAAIGSSAMAGSATVQLNGGSFIQSGSVLNTSAPSVSIVKVVYDLGPQVVGSAIWEVNTSTGAHSNFLTGNWYSTETWESLSVGAGNTFSFSGLDIDLITGITPPAVTSSTLGTGSSLAGASFSVYFSDNSWGKANLAQFNWNDSQEFQINVTPVPEPETYALMLAGLGVMGALVRRRKQRSAA